MRIPSLGRRLAAVLALALPITLAAPAVASAACPCTVFGPFDAPVVTAADDTGAVNLGMRFRADSAGYVKGVRFYKGSANTGTHVGHLWSSSGTLLATVTFVDETASGWQQAELSTPVAITANTTYVVSYFAPNGGYAFTSGGYAAQVDAAPLHGLASSASGGNGVFAYGSTSSFPTSSFNSANYWVDVVFDEA